MLSLFAFAAATAAVQPIVSTEWLEAHLNDPNVVVIDTSAHDAYERAHIPGARLMDHMATVGADHRPLPPDALARLWGASGVGDDSHVVLYGDSPMTNGWMYLSLAIIGHGDQVSILDGGITLWEREHRPVSKQPPAVRPAALTVRPQPDTIVDAAWVRSRLDSPTTRILDVRTAQEWNGGHLPGATLVLWQDLYADLETLKLKPAPDIRALLTRAGVGANQEAVTYCAIGMRASLMYFVARAVGVPARVYAGSWQDWRRDSTNPIVK